MTRGQAYTVGAVLEELTDLGLSLDDAIEVAASYGVVLTGR